MLRTIKTNHLRPFLLAYTATTAASAINTLNYGAGIGTLSNAVDDSRLNMAPNRAFGRTPIMVASAGADIGDGGTAIMYDAASASNFQAQTVDGSGSGDVGTQHCLVLGYHSTDSTKYGKKYEKQFPVHGKFKGSRIVSGVVNSNGSVFIGGTQFTVTKNGTGDYTVTFTSPFGLVPVVVATPAGAAGANLRVNAVTANTFQILTFDDANSAADLYFHFMAYGTDRSTDYYSDKGSAIQAPFRRPRMLAIGGIDTSAPSIGIHSSEASISSLGTANVRVTFAEAFARSPVVLAFSGTSGVRYASINGLASTHVDIIVGDASGSATNSGRTDLLILGSDDADEY